MIVVSDEIFRCLSAACITVNALFVDVVFSCLVVGPFERFVCHISDLAHSSGTLEA